MFLAKRMELLADEMKLPSLPREHPDKLIRPFCPAINLYRKIKYD
jgi:hypothetical protein